MVPSALRLPRAVLRAAPAAAAAGGARASSSYPYARQLDASSIKGRHLDDLFSFTGAELEALLAMAHALKHQMGTLKRVYQPLVRPPRPARRGGARRLRGAWPSAAHRAHHGMPDTPVRRSLPAHPRARHNRRRRDAACP